VTGYKPDPRWPGAERFGNTEGRIMRDDECVGVVIRQVVGGHRVFYAYLMSGGRRVVDYQGRHVGRQVPSVNAGFDWLTVNLGGAS
jgi:hypothetical protein